MDPNPKDRVDPVIEEKVLEYALEQPEHRQVRASIKLRKRGVFVSPSGVRGILLRNGPQTFKLRLKVQEAQAAAAGECRLQGRALPVVDHVRMHLLRGRLFGDHVVAADCGQIQPNLEVR